MTGASAPKLEYRISFGNLLQIGVMLVAIAAAFFTLRGEVTLNAEEIARIEASVKANTDAITSLRIGEASEIQKLSNLDEHVRRIDVKLDEVLSELRMQRSPMPDDE